MIRESAIEAHLVRKVRAAGGIAYKWISPGRAGVPDRIVVLPGAYSVFVELKSPGAKPDAHQLREHQRLMKLGMRVVVIDTMEGVDQLMDKVPG